jgi:hypothetical protein
MLRFERPGSLFFALGKVLKDEETVASAKLEEKGFIVCMTPKVSDARAFMCSWMLMSRAAQSRSSHLSCPRYARKCSIDACSGCRLDARAASRTCRGPKRYRGSATVTHSCSTCASIGGGWRFHGPLGARAG